jgi:hypothetical protein
MELIELHLLADKKKWQNRFAKAYKSSELRITKEVFGDSARFFVAKTNGKEMGFIRITNKSKFFKNQVDYEIWNLSDAYVKQAYRNQGVLKEMLQIAIANQNVKVCCLVPDVFNRHYAYYEKLGFTSSFTGSESGLIWLIHKDIADLIKFSDDSHKTVKA